jgi:hypothetical protein
MLAIGMYRGHDAGSLPEWVGYVLLAVAVVGFLIFEMFKSRLKPLQRLLSSAAPMTKEEQAAFAVRGIHIALTMLLTIFLIAIGIMDMPLVYTLIAYMLLGWIPLRIWLYPILLQADEMKTMWPNQIR